MIITCANAISKTRKQKVGLVKTFLKIFLSLLRILAYINLSSFLTYIEKIENRHNYENVENISEMSACTMTLVKNTIDCIIMLKFTEKGRTIPVIKSSWIYESILPVELIHRIWLREKVFSSEANAVKYNNHIE